MSKFLCTYILGYSIAVSCLIPTSSKAVESNTQSQLSQFQCTETEMNKYIQQLKNGEPAAFNRLVECNSKAVPALTKALENEDENLRIALITALGEIGGKSSPTLPLLNKLLNDINLDVRIVTIYALRQIGKDAIPALITALQDKDSEVRSGAVDALGQIGENAKDAVPALITTLQDKDGNVRYRAAYALGLIGKDAVPALITTLQDKDGNVRSGAAYALGLIGKDAKDAVSKIAELLLNKNESLYIRYIASEALENIGSMQAISILVQNKSIIADIREESKRWNFGGNITINQTIIDIKDEGEMWNYGSSGNAGLITIRLSTTAYINRKPPLICKIPQIKNLLRWKCP